MTAQLVCLILKTWILCTYPLCASFIQDRKEILGELQFAFVCFLVGQGIDTLCRQMRFNQCGVHCGKYEFVFRSFLSFLFFSLAWSITFVNCKESGNIFPTWSKQPSPMKCLLNIIDIQLLCNFANKNAHSLPPNTFLHHFLEVDSIIVVSQACFKKLCCLIKIDEKFPFIQVLRKENQCIFLQALTDAMLLSDYGVGIEVQRLLPKGPTPPTMFHRLQLSHRHKCCLKTVIIQCSNLNILP